MGEFKSQDSASAHQYNPIWLIFPYRPHNRTITDHFDPLASQFDRVAPVGGIVLVRSWKPFIRALAKNAIFSIQSKLNELAKFLANILDIIRNFINDGLPGSPLGRLAWIISAIIALYIAYYDPASLSGRVETTAEAVAQQIFGGSYPSTASSRIVVLQTTVEGYEDNPRGLGKPLSYSELATLIDTAVAAQARSVFIDYQFRERPYGPRAAGVAALAAAAARARSSGVAVFSGPIRDIPVLSPLRRAIEQVGVARNVQHPADYNIQIGQPRRLSAAPALYLAYCGASAPDPLCDAQLTARLQAAGSGKDMLEPMAMRFGNGAGVADFDQNNGECRTDHFLARLHGLLATSATKASCTQHVTIPIDILLDSKLPQILPYIKGRMVLIGSGSGLGDDHLIPGVGEVPGVQLHAMALDNLLSWGTRYPHWPPNLTKHGEIGSDEIFQLAIILLVPVGLTAIAMRAVKRFADAPVRAAYVVVASVGVTLALLLLFATAFSLLFDWPTGSILLELTLAGAVISVMSGEELSLALSALNNRSTMWCAVALLSAIAAIAGLWGSAIALAAAIFFFDRKALRARLARPPAPPAILDDQPDHPSNPLQPPVARDEAA